MASAKNKKHDAGIRNQYFIGKCFIVSVVLIYIYSTVLVNRTNLRHNDKYNAKLMCNRQSYKTVLTQKNKLSKYNYCYNLDFLEINS